MTADDPDWARAGIHPPNKFGPLGDPTRWGATVVQAMPAIDGVVFRGGILQSGQVVSAQCRDQYPRAWTIAGTIGAPAFAWLLPDGFALNQFASALYVTMGQGQTQLVHNFNIRAIVSADAPFYWFSDFQTPFGSEGLETRAFLIPGAVVGNAVNIQVWNAYFSNVASDPFNFVTSVIISPFDPGAAT